MADTLYTRARRAMRNPLVAAYVHSAIAVTTCSFLGTCLALWVMR